MSSCPIVNYDDDDLDRDAELDECSALTGLERASGGSTNELMNEQTNKCSSRSPSRMLMGAITGVFGQRSPSSLSVLSGSLDSSKRNSDEVQILIESSSGNSGPDDSASTTSSALDSFTLCSTSSSSMPIVSSYNPSRISRFIVTTTSACVDTSSSTPSATSSSHTTNTTANMSGTMNPIQNSSIISNDGKTPSRQSNSNRLNETRRVHHLSRPSRIASCMSVQSMDSVASSNSSLSDYPPGTPICKFCHQRARANDPLISPCHCKGTIRYMHCRCLMVTFSSSHALFRLDFKLKFSLSLLEMA